MLPGSVDPRNQPLDWCLAAAALRNKLTFFGPSTEVVLYNRPDATDEGACNAEKNPPGLCIGVPREGAAAAGDFAVIPDFTFLCGEDLLYSGGAAIQFSLCKAENIGSDSFQMKKRHPKCPNHCLQYEGR